MKFGYLTPGISWKHAVTTHPDGVEVEVNLEAKVTRL